MRSKSRALALMLLAVLALSACGPKTNEPDPAGTCTLTVECTAVLEDPDALDPATLELLPEDGYIVKETEVSFYEGDSAFAVLQRELAAAEIQMEYEGSSAYVTGIANLYAYDAGEMSGWLYTVNGQSPDVGASEYTVAGGDRLVWSYTLDFSALF